MTDTPTVTLTFSAAWGSYILGALEPLARKANWDGTEADVYAAQQEIEALINQF